MSVKINGIGKLKANYYNKLVIKENSTEKTYQVDVKGDKNNFEIETIGNRFSEDFRKKTDIEQVKAIIEDYIRNTKICGITDLITLPAYGNQRFNIIYGNFGYRAMLLKLFNKEFNNTFKKIQEKYYQDRFDFCYEENGIKTFKISTNGTGSNYNINLDKLNRCSKETEFFKQINLRTKNFQILDSEKEFIKEFIINIFSKFGEKIQIEKVYNTEYDFTRNDVLGYNIKCGDVKIYIDKYEPLLFILVIVGNYNLNLQYEQEKCMKRQLKMEGF